MTVEEQLAHELEQQAVEYRSIEARIPHVNVADKYELHDITVVTTDGKHATADVVYSRNGGDLCTVRVEYTDAKINGGFSTLDGLPAEGYFDLVEEVTSECAEACAYQRDILREMH